ncbi:Plastocyanin [Paenibacillus sp. UNC496MF]|uniref:cupredoxin domain-containing protein n=1 Tax=Paenibacillus sp. UNC496MF TaxID=1502753 RepID=UPI0008DF0149|nr:cupredoxin family copper-binding protein [Paenibacillus sp. UNC496MF]SFJ13021.1 Plastocyanin [Paenibacillus sp. UNC496MF]
MTTQTRPRRRSTIAGLGLLLACCLALAACGNSGNGAAANDQAGGGNAVAETGNAGGGQNAAADNGGGDAVTANGGGGAAGNAGGDASGSTDGGASADGGQSTGANDGAMPDYSGGGAANKPADPPKASDDHPSASDKTGDKPAASVSGKSGADDHPSASDKADGGKGGGAAAPSTGKGGTEDKPKPGEDDGKTAAKPPQTAGKDDKPAAGETAKPKTYTVEIKDFAFSPAKLDIKAGDSVTFINRDEIEHTATSVDGVFDTDLLAKDASKTVAFKDAGSFSYNCTPHPGMKGVITVK